MPCVGFWQMPGLNREAPALFAGSLVQLAVEHLLEREVDFLLIHVVVQLEGFERLGVGDHVFELSDALHVISPSG